MASESNVEFKSRARPVGIGISEIAGEPVAGAPVGEATGSPRRARKAQLSMIRRQTTVEGTPSSFRGKPALVVSFATLTAAVAASTFLSTSRTPAQAAPREQVEIIRGPYLQNASLEGVDVRWEVDRMGASSLQLIGPEGASRRVDSPFRGRMHRVRLTGLKPGEYYTYRVRSRDELLPTEHRFRATPDSAVPFTFAVMGDFGAETKGQEGVAKLLESSNAEFNVLTGDLVYSRGEFEHYDLRIFQPYRNSMPKMTFWPSLGNHDVGSQDGAAALAWFNVPLNGPKNVQGGRNYSFEYGNAHFVALDSNASPEMMKRDLVPWLEADLGKTTKPWKFVFFHHAPYSSASHGENAEMRDIMAPVFTRLGVDIAFAGHDHSYERTKPINKVIYIVSGNGGNSLYQHKNPHDYSEVFYVKKHGLTLVTIHGNRLELRHQNVDREEIDRFELRK